MGIVRGVPFNLKFWIEMTHILARSLCVSWATCYAWFTPPTKTRQSRLALSCLCWRCELGINVCNVCLLLYCNGQFLHHFFTFHDTALWHVPTLSHLYGKITWFVIYGPSKLETLFTENCCIVLSLPRVVIVLLLCVIIVVTLSYVFYHVVKCIKCTLMSHKSWMSNFEITLPNLTDFENSFTLETEVDFFLEKYKKILTTP